MLWKEGYKIHLLQEESIQGLYQKRLAQYITKPTSGNVDEEWRIIQEAHNALGKKKISRRKRGLNIWDKEIQEAIQEKRKAYRIYLQQRTEYSKEEYILKKNRGKGIVRKAHQSSWEIHSQFRS